MSGAALTEADLEHELAVVRASAAEDLAGIFGPGSMVWRIDREAAVFLGAGRALLLQLAHPWVAAAIAEHSQSLADPIGRFHRTFGLVFTMVFGTTDEAVAAARRLYRRHAGIGGILAENAGSSPAGAAYRANDVAALRWVFATLADSAIIAFELVNPPLSAAERERYYGEFRLFAGFFGIPQTALPQSWPAFADYVEEMLSSDTLAVSSAARTIAAALFSGTGTWLRAPQWYRAFTASLLPERLRDEFALRWGPAEQRAAKRALAVLRFGYRHLPGILRYVGPYREACARLAGRNRPAILTRLLNRFWIGRNSIAADLRRGGGDILGPSRMLETRMAQPEAMPAEASHTNSLSVPAGTDLVEWYFAQGWTDGLPVVPPTRERVGEFVAALGGDPDFVECKVPPRHGSLSREVLAVNMVMAGCKPEYAPVVRAAMLALTANAFNLNGVQATTHMAAPLLIVNGPVARVIGMNGDCNAFGSGNRANATIGRALRLVLLNVGGGRPGDLDKSTLGHPGKYTYCVAENQTASPWAPYHVEKGFGPDDSTVFVLAAEPPHSVTNHVANDPEGILDSISSAMSTIANNNAVSSGHCAVIIGPEHARTIAGKGWSRHDVKSYLAMNAYNLFSELTFNERYGKIYNRNLPRWYKREQGSRIPVVPGPDHIHLFVVGGEAGRFSAFIPGWGHMSSPVLRSVESDTRPEREPVCVDGTCYL